MCASARKPSCFSSNGKSSQRVGGPRLVGRCLSARRAYISMMRLGTRRGERWKGEINSGHVHYGTVSRAAQNHHWSVATRNKPAKAIDEVAPLLSRDGSQKLTLPVSLLCTFALNVVGRGLSVRLKGDSHESVRLIHQFESLKNGSLLTRRAGQARTAIRKIWLARQERVIRSIGWPRRNLAVVENGIAGRTTENPVRSASFWNRRGSHPDADSSIAISRDNTADYL